MIVEQLRCNILIAIFFLTAQYTFSQEQIDTAELKTEFYNLRGSNAIDIAMGTSVINGDLADPQFEFYGHIGYKRHLTPYLALDFGYHKFNLAYIDQYNEGFMSFDLNVEFLLIPHQRFSPFIFVGLGYNASNEFEDTAFKSQGGAGLEYIVSNQFALKLYTDYNYVASDTLDGKEAGGADDTYFRVAFGVNYYFGGSTTKAKRVKDNATVIETNSITDDNNSPKL